MSAPIPFGWSVRSRRPIDDRFITADLTTRDALDTFRRVEGLETYVESDDTTYKLVGGIADVNWVEVLKNINLLTEETTIDTANDTIAFWDASASRHRKVKFEDLPIDGSKWTEVANGIYRNGRVAIGTTTVGTTKSLDVVGNSRFSGTAFDSVLTKRTITDATPNIYISSTLTLARSGGILTGQGAGFWFLADEDTANGRMGIFGAVKRGTNTGDLNFLTYNASSVARHGMTIRANKGVYIGDEIASFDASTEESSLEVKNRIKTGNVGSSTARYVKMGDVTTGTITPDRIWRIEINGVEYDVPLKLA